MFQTGIFLFSLPYDSRCKMAAPSLFYLSFNTIKCGNLRNWRDPGQQPPCKGRPPALASSPFPRSAAQREKGEGAQRLRGMCLISS